MHHLFIATALSALFILSCTSGEKKQMPVGQVIYKQYCVLCHGTDGKLGLNGSRDLTASTLSQEERITIITFGKGTMGPFKSILSEDEIRAVAAYTGTLNDKE